MINKLIRRLSRSMKRFPSCFVKVMQAQLAFFLFVFLVPLRVFAESNTYIVLDSCKVFDNLNNNSDVFRIAIKNNSSDVRALRMYDNLFLVSEHSFDYRIDSNYFGSFSCPVETGFNSAQFAQNYYVVWQQKSLYSNMDIVNVQDTVSTQNAIYYTFGAGAVGPVEPVNWGLLRDVRYDTSIAGNGLASSNNIDYLSWNKFVDSNNNDISNMHVEVQAVPGYWRGSDYQDYISKKYSDFDNGSLSTVSLGSISVSLGGFSVSWNAVYSKFGFSNYDIYASLKGAVWESIGWYYQIRLVTDDGYVGEWQTLYSVTSASSEGVQNIINHNEFNSTTSSYMQTITQINSQETVNITYNDTTITIENPDANPEPEGGTNLWDVLKQLINGLFQLLVKLGEIVGDLLNGLLDFFRIDNFSIPDFSTHQQQLHDNSGIFGQSIDFEHTLYDTVHNVSASDPVLTYPGLTLQGVEFIPPVNVNLNDYIRDMGLESYHEMAYVVTDGIIYISLFLQVLKYLKEILNK